MFTPAEGDDVAEGAIDRAADDDSGANAQGGAGGAGGRRVQSADGERKDARVRPADRGRFVV